MKKLKRYALPRLKPMNKEYKKVLKEDESSLDEYIITPDVLLNETILKEIFYGCSDVVFRFIKVFGQTGGLLIYIDGLADTKLIDNILIKELVSEKAFEESESLEGIIKVLEKKILTIGHIKTVTLTNEAVKSILDGNTAIFIDGESSVLIASTAGGEKRSISEPTTETVIRGPREGFTEDIRTNTSLLRKRLRTTKLKYESFTLGEISQTNVTIAYLQGVANDLVVQEARDRVSRIKIDGVLESGYIEEFIEDKSYTVFPLIQNTERPDVVAASLLEGKVAIFTDNTPFVLLVPTVFWGLLHSSEDYYERFVMGTVLRWIRFIFLFFALLAPALYVAVTTFHQEMIPAKLLMSIIDAREPTPFPAFVEALLMEITFEALREAGLRLPSPIAQTVSVVGALVIGQAAVQAGLVSAPMVIVVSITGIASFTIPRYDLAFAIRILRFPVIFLAGTLGLYGVTLGVLGILIHLVGLRSFGIPYLSPVSPPNTRGMKDVFVRVPWWNMNTRPSLISDYNNIRIPPKQQPRPKQGDRGNRGSDENR